MKKIEEQDLKQLKNLQQQNSKIIIELGEIEYNKLLLQKKSDYLLSQINDLLDEENTLKEYLVSKYGDKIDINLETGEY